MVLDGIMEMRMLPVSRATTVEAAEADVQTCRVILYISCQSVLLSLGGKYHDN